MARAILFQGGRYDNATGLYHFGARDYDPVEQRWIEQDPMGYNAGDSDLYRMEGDNPVNRVDPSGNWFGLEIWWPLGAAPWWE